jgi:hypothetical protein
VSYTPLPIIEVDVDDLRLDLENYRIPLRPDDDLAALRYLFAAEEVLTLVKQLLRDGYFDNEVPIVVEESGEHVVLEGNRRVSALKAIRNPGLVPHHEAEVRALLTRYAAEATDMPTAIRVIVAPSRQVARPHIARLHTGLSKKSWSRDQQANYYHSILGPGIGIDDLKAMYPDVSIVRFLRMVEIRLFLDGVKFKDGSLHDYVRSEELKMSAFEYAYRIVEVAEAIGVVFDGYQIEPTSKTPHAIGAGLSTTERAAVEHLMQRFRAGTLNTRSPEFKKNDPKRDELIAILRAGGKAAPDTGGDPDPDVDDDDDSDDSNPGGGPSDSGPGQGPTDDPEDEDPGDEPEDDEGGKRGPNNPDTRKGFDIGGLPLDLINANLKHRYVELRRIDVGRTPAAAAMLLRSVLEGTIKWHFSGTQHAVTGELKLCVERLHDVYGKERLLKDSINTIKSGAASKAGSQHWMNAAAHNPDVPVSEADVRHAYRVMLPVLSQLLVPYRP